MANAVFGARFPQYVQNQINQRQAGMSGGGHIKAVNKDEKGNVVLDFYDSFDTKETFFRQTCFVRLLSSIDIDNDKGKAAQKYILYGTQFGAGETILSTTENKDLAEVSKSWLNPSLLNYTIGIAPDLDNPYIASYGFLSDKNYGFVPPPGIVSVDIKALNRGSLKEANINLLCHSIDQFNIIDKLYLRLGYTMVLDWGWTQYEKNNNTLGKTENELQSTLLPTLAFSEEGYNYEIILDTIEKLRDSSDGNYDAMIGRVVNYSWNLERDGSYNITLTMRSVGDVIESLKANTSHPVATTSDVKVVESSGGVEETGNLAPVEYNKEKSSLNRILWFFSSLFSSDNGPKILSSDYTTHEKITSGTQLSSNRKLSAGASKMDLASFAFPSLEGVEKNYGGEKTKYQYYVRLGCLLRSVCDYLLLYDDQSSSLININYDKDDNFMFTYNRHGSLDPRVCLIPINATLNSTSEETTPNPAQTSTPSKYDYIDETYTWNSIRVVPYGNENDYHNGPWLNHKGEDGWPILSGKVYMTDNEENDLSAFPIDDNDRDSVNNADVYNEIIEAINKTDAPRTTEGDQIEWGGINLLDIERLAYFNGKKDKNYTPDLEVMNTVEYKMFSKQSWTGGEEIQIWNIDAGDVKNRLNSNSSDSQKLWENYYYPVAIASPKPTKTNINQILGQYVVIDPGLHPLNINDSNQKPKEIIYKNTLGNTLFKIIVYTHQAVIRQYIDPNTNLSGADVINILNEEEKAIDVKNNLYTKYINPNSEFRTTQDFAGRTMEIMVNTNYIAKTLESYIDIKTGDISLYDFLDKLMSGIQNALGNINRFSVTYNEDKNEFKITDSTFIPGLGNVKRDYFNSNISKFSLDTRFLNNYHTLDFYTYNSQDVHRSSFVRDFSIKTKLSNNFAAMTTIGAQVNGNVVGENATALSKWNDGLVDRLYKVKKNLNDPNKDDSVDNSYASNCGVLQVLNDRVNDGNITNEQIDGSTNPCTDLFRYEIGNYVNKGEIPPIGFLPIDLELTMDGISGMKIYEVFDIDDKYLPETYNNSIQFIATGISHKIQNNDWTTTINSICGPKYDPYKSSTGDKPKRVKVKYAETVESEKGGSKINVGASQTGDGIVSYLKNSNGTRIENYWGVAIHHGPKNPQNHPTSNNTNWRVEHRYSVLLNSFTPKTHPKYNIIKQRNDNKEFGVWDFIQYNYIKDSSGKLTPTETNSVDMLSPFDGVIGDVGTDSKGNPFVIVISDEGKSALFLHFDTTYVKKDERVKKGTALGVQGNKGKSDGVHTHIEGMMPEDFAEYINYLLSLRAKTPPTK